MASATTKEKEDTLEEFIRRNSHYGAGRVGSEYWSTRKLDVKDIAKLVRADIAKMGYEGKASVKIDRYRGGCSINVEFKRAKSCKLDPAGINLGIEHILEKYNFDFSNGMYDYFHRRFYSNVRILEC